MAEIKWIKLDVNMFDNRKIKQIRTLPEGDSLCIIWLQLLCLAGIVNDNGSIYLTPEIPYTEEMLSTSFNEPINTIRLALETFSRFGMVEIIDNIIYVSNWEKYQNIDGMEKIRQQTRQRVSNYREKQKQIGNVTSNVTVTLRNATDIDKEEDKNKNKNIRFSKPTMAEVVAYISENNYNVDADRWYSYYESNGWMVGRNHMKDWKACVRQWNSREKKNSKLPDFTYKSTDNLADDFKAELKHIEEKKRIEERKPITDATIEAWLEEIKNEH